MSDTLHILNGDATFTGFEHTGLDGDVLIWREVLSEGPVSENIESARFWENRSAWICETFNDVPQNYNDNIIAKLAKLNEPYKTINVWFDFDLHCQINLLGVLMLLSQQTNLSNPAVYLICPQGHPDIADFRGIGELNARQMEYLYDNIRVRLSDYDFELATEAWDVYIGADAERVTQWINSTQFWANMSALKPAMLAHVKRLQTNAAGLNYIQQKLLDIYNSGIHSRANIYAAFWADEKIYGMGDMEINNYLNQLIAKQLIAL